MKMTNELTRPSKNELSTTRELSEELLLEQTFALCEELRQYKMAVLDMKSLRPDAPKAEEEQTQGNQLVLGGNLPLATIQEETALAVTEQQAALSVKLDEVIHDAFQGNIEWTWSQGGFFSEEMARYAGTYHEDRIKLLQENLRRGNRVFGILSNVHHTLSKDIESYRQERAFTYENRNTAKHGHSPWIFECHYETDRDKEHNRLLRGIFPDST